MSSPDELTGPINLGSSDEISILELARVVIELTNSSSEILFEPAPEDDPIRRQPDTSLARQALGWQARVSLEEGLARTIEYFEQLIEPGNAGQAG